MNDVKQMFNEALKDEPPARALDIDALEKSGRTRSQHHRLGMAGAATASVAIVAAAALLLPGVFGGGADDQATPTPPAAGAEEQGPAEQPEFPLPALDPDRKYVFSPAESTETLETAQLTEAFWEFMTQNLPDMKVLDTDDNSGGWLAPEDYPVMDRTEGHLRILAEDSEYPSGGSSSTDGEPIGYNRPVYGFNAEAGLFGAVTVRGDDDRDVYDQFDLSIHPKGSFDAEPKSYPEATPSVPVVPHLSTGCEDQSSSGQGGTNNFGQDFECSETTGPNGEAVQVVEMILTAGDPDFISMKLTTVIVTLTNGNAVLINNMTSAGSIDDHSEYVDLSDVPTVFDAEQLVELAVALPQVMVH